MNVRIIQWKRAAKAVLLVLLLSVVGMTRMYADVTIGNLNYSLNSSSHTATVTGHKDGTSATGNLIIPSSVTYGGQTYSVTEIGVWAFYNCSTLTGSLTIPNSVTRIGGSAFESCTSFTGSLTIGNSVTSIDREAFCNCSGFTGSLIIPNSVTTIGYNAFKNCSGFTGNLTIPNSIIFLSGFKGCTGLTGELIIPNSVNEIGIDAFSGCSGFTGSLTIPNSVTTINGQAFYGCSGFTGTLTIPNSVTSIGVHAFYGCSGFTGSLTIPNSVTTISDEAFSHCSGFTGSLTIPSSVTSIGSYAFYGCSGFTGSLTIPNSVTSIGNRAFTNCNNLTGSLTIPNSVTSIGSYAFYGCSGFTGSLTIPSSVTSIGSYAFSGCNGFTGSLTIPNSVTSIGNHAFFWCSGFTGSLTIPNSVTTIGGSAFYGCSGFTGSLTIGNSVTTIGERAFGFCGVFTGVYYTGDIGQWCNISFGDYDSNPLRDAHNLYVNNALVTNLVIPGNVTEIKAYAFYEATCLTSLSIGNSVTMIGDGAFYGCSGFMGSLTIPNSVTTIGGSAFYGCSGFTGSLTIPNSVTTIGGSAFYGCSGFTGSLTLPNSMITISDYTFGGCSGFTGSLTLPNSVTTIGKWAFIGCSGFTGELIIPNSVTSIGDIAFRECSGLTGRVTIPNSVIEIGGNVFERCIGLEQIVVSPANPMYDSRENCNAIIETSTNTLIAGCKNTIIPNSVTAIGDFAFSYLSSFRGNLTIPNSVISIGDGAFMDCTGLTGDLTIPNSVTTIGVYAFAHCSGFTGTLTIPGSVTTIGAVAFEECRFTGSLIIPNSISRIELGTFNMCWNFTSVEIPESVTFIGERAFACWYGMQTMTVLATPPPTLENYAFVNVNKSIPVYVPVGTIAAYQAAQGWNEFTNYHEIESTSYTITASANPAEGGSVIGIGIYTEGAACTLTATANEGYSFVNWTENNEVVSTNANYSFTVSGNRNIVANFALSGTTTNHWIPEGSSYSEIMAMYTVIQIDGVEQYSNMLEIGVFCGEECRGSAIASEFNLTHRYLAILNVFGESGHQLTFKLYDHSIGQELDLTSPATVTFDVNGYGNPVEPYVLNFTSSITHSQELNSGWNWWSTYVEQNGIDGLGMLENSIGSAGVRIQGRNGTIDQFEYQGSNYWYGSLTSIENEQMYKIHTNTDCNAVVVGYAALPANHPITINNGWNWIGYPCGQSLDINVALNGFTPEANDVIKGRIGSSTFVSYGSNNLWYGTLNTLEPGVGYMYKSNSNTSKTLIFQTGRGEGTVTNVTEDNSFFISNTTDFSDNMLLTAVIDMDGQELRSEDYEVAAYVGNECRGSVKLMYVEPFDRYVAFLLVFGEAEEDIHFVLTDGNGVSWSDDLLTYTADGLEGTLTEPVTLHFRALGLNDNEHEFVNVFPNPSDGVFNIEGNGIHKIEVVNAFGQTILSSEVDNNLMQIDLSDKATGIYLLRIITNNGVTTKQLIKE